MNKMLLLFIMFVSQISFAQVPSLTIQDEDKKQELEISQLNVDVNIIGNIATTTYDIVFYNPLSRILEGELSLPLNDGQEICRYALDINGKLREGVVVEKIHARQTFEAIVRQNIDPGIISKTKGNFFKTKIYPIPSRGTKRVLLSLSETLTGDKNNLFYSLPIETSKNIKEFKLDVKVIKNQSDNKPILSDFDNITFDNQDDAYCLNFERKKFSSKNPLKFTIPRFVKSDHQLFTYEFEGETYFYLNVKTPELKQIKKNPPQKITVYWDNSFSSSKRNIEKELKFLDRYLLSLKGSKNISLVTFNQKVDEPKTFKIKKSTRKLINYIKSLKNDGATCVDNIKFDSHCDEILFFSDGINTIGNETTDIPDKPIYSITSSSGSNYTLLKKFALKTNGEFINLNILTLDKALNLIQIDEEKFLSCNYNNSDFREVYPNTARTVGDNFEIVGILKNDKASLKVNYGHKGEITHVKSYNIIKGSNTPVTRIWASKKIEALDLDYDKNNEETLYLGQKFNIITRNTAFIVLDRIEDYVEHNIIPPDELKDKYYELLAQKEKGSKFSPKLNTQRNIERINLLKSWYKSPKIPTKLKKSLLGDSSNASAVEERDTEIESFNIQEVSMDDAPPPLAQARESASDQTSQSAAPGKSDDTSKSSIKVLAWLPNAPYMEEIRKDDYNNFDSLYFKLKEENRNRPAFYLQVADFLFGKKIKDKAIRILTNIIELDLENPELLKVVAKRLLNEGDYVTAIQIYMEIKKLRPEEPQSFRDLALAYEKNGQFQEALGLFKYILDNNWERFEDIKDVVLNEMNGLIASQKKIDIGKIDSEYIHSMPLDVRITIDWSSNDNDIDLWVIDPKGEKCYYQHPNTQIGGKISRDFTQGYGPEEFTLKNAKRGLYTVYVNYFSESRQTITGPVTVYATLTTNFGTSKQETKYISLQLGDNKETRQIGQLEFQK